VTSLQRFERVDCLSAGISAVNAIAILVALIAAVVAGIAGRIMAVDAVLTAVLVLPTARVRTSAHAEVQCFKFI
jgi:hypothetical protein